MAQNATIQRTTAPIFFVVVSLADCFYPHC